MFVVGYVLISNTQNYLFNQTQIALGVLSWRSRSQEETYSCQQQPNHSQWHLSILISVKFPNSEGFRHGPDIRILDILIVIFKLRYCV